MERVGEGVGADPEFWREEEGFVLFLFLFSFSFLFLFLFCFVLFCFVLFIFLFLFLFFVRVSILMSKINRKKTNQSKEG